VRVTLFQAGAESQTSILRHWRDTAFILVATAFSVLIIQTNSVGYDSGTGDHTVILPAGLLRADQNLYLGDYFIRNAVMPHWFFEHLTTIAAKLNMLSHFFFWFWILTIGVFVAANLLLAKTLLKKNAQTSAFIMVGVQIMGARVVFGTSAPVLEQALPHTMAGSLTFLMLAMWFSGLRKQVFILLPFLPIIHIQIGAIALGIVVLLLLIEWFQSRLWSFSSLYSVGATCCTTLFGLLFRPIAGNTKEFSEICERLIPHHCFAPSWSREQITFCIIFILIGLTAVFAVTNNQRQRNFLSCSIGVPVLVLSFSLAMDRFGSGFLVDLVRGNNVYRLAVVVLPFLYWAPLFIINGSVVTRQRKILALVTFLLLLRLITLKEHGSRFVDTPQMLGVVLIASLVVFVNSRWKISSALSKNIANSFVILALVGSVFTFNVQPARMPDITFIPSSLERSFGSALRNAAPLGRQVAGDPTMNFVRMASGVGYAVDCKFRPIGGGEPLLEFYRRLEPLGGYEAACRSYSFNSVTATNLIQYASISNSDLLLLPLSDSRVVELTSSGWTVIESEELASVGQVLLSLD
jgi:hypothetical protein